MKLEINGLEADFEGDLAITRQTFDSDNVGIKLIDISNKVVLPHSDKNKKIIGNFNRLESDSLDVNFDAKIIDSYFLFNGAGFLSEAGNTWRFQLADKSKVLFDDMKKKLNELDLESDDFVYGSSAYNELREKTESVWIWPIVQMHESVIATDLQYLRPHFRMWNLLQNIFDSRGYSLDFDTDLIQGLGIQSNSKDFLFTSYQKTLNGLSIGDLSSNDHSNLVTTTFFTIDVGTNKTAFRLRGTANSIGESKITFNDDEIILSDGENVYDETTSELEGVVTIGLTGNVNFVDTLLYTIIKESSFTDLAAFNPSGFLVKTYDNMINVSQIDLFKDALIYTNSIIVPDNLRAEINIKSLNRLNPQNKVDWSEKFIDKSDSVKSALGGLSQKNLLTYKNGVGDFHFNTQIDHIKDEDDYIKLRYSGSPDKEDYAVYNVYETEVVDEVTNNVRADGSELRIVFVDGYNGKFTPVNWTNIVQNYYSNYFESLRKPRQLTAKFNLKKLDVVGFDPLELVYLDQFNSNFIIESINNYIVGREVTVKLLKYSGAVVPLPQPIIEEVTKYGLLYNWYAAIDPKIAPTNWKVPDNNDRSELYNTVGVNGGGSLKAEGFDFWDSPNTGATNSTGFSAYGSSFRLSDGTFGLLKTSWNVWTTFEASEFEAGNFKLFHNSTNFQEYINVSSKTNGQSLRLLWSGVGTPPAQITDYDGHTYDVIQIGSQYWIKQNWKCTHLNDGAPIPNVTDNTDWSNLSTMGYCAYDNDLNNV